MARVLHRSGPLHHCAAHQDKPHCCWAPLGFFTPNSRGPGVYLMPVLPSDPAAAIKRETESGTCATGFTPNAMLG